MTASKTISEKDGEEALRVAALYQAQQAEAANKQRSEKLKPLLDLVDGKTFSAVADTIAELLRGGTFADEPTIIVHLQAAQHVLPALRASVL